MAPTRFVPKIVPSFVIVIVDSVIVVLPLVDRWFAKKLQNVAHTRKILRASSEE